MKTVLSFRYLLPFFLILSVVPLHSQYMEVGISIGGSNYLGDLAPSQIWTSVGDIHLSGGVLVRLNWNDRIALRSGLYYGQITASDKRSEVQSGRRSRNLSFRSSIYEFSLGAEINILAYQPYLRGKGFTPYVFGGLAVFKFNPQAEWNGQWYDLQPLGTEGQGLAGNAKKYRLVQIAIPVAIGLKFALSKKFNIGLETGMRKTFTDHLDDVSGSYPNLVELAAQDQLAAEFSWRGDEVNPEALPPAPNSGRGDPDDLDWYIFSEFSISYNFISSGRRRGQRRSTKLRCPKF